uniref:Delta-latroinsectotoxin-Lhe1a (Fragments) n=1 Tax=Latrodectus hesperus TaxID=256737 RepID=LITD_LATHE|nr:RecName: Full=Delta-latroinsectotoxin-Lhe1a; Short=Delta-LIT-Lhe1a; AltName: Full=Delta-latroinsectotoxin; Short=Delta-LIT [Latrodectus hesperus]
EPSGNSLSSALNELLDKNNNYAIPKVAIIFDDFKSSLTGGDDGLIDNVIEVLNTVKVSINSVTENNNWTPLHFAIYFKKNPAVSAVLILENKDIEARTSIMLIVQKLLLELYNYFINNYAETLDEEALFNRLDEQGKLELALIMHNK